jgi:Protein of unknown function (DUF3501)
MAFRNKYMNTKVTRDSLMTLEAYSKARTDFRKQVLEHKKLRTIALGDHVTLLFEDELTVRYQIQEMLRVEKIFDEEGIQHEIDSYNPLIPDGNNFKATMLIEYTDEAIRRKMLTQLKGIERKVFVQVEGAKKVYAIADEDLERENEDKTSAVHFLRFQLDADMVKSLQYGVALSMGVEHENYVAMLAPLPTAHQQALLKDLA